MKLGVPTGGADNPDPTKRFIGMFQDLMAELEIEQVREVRICVYHITIKTDSCCLSRRVLAGSLRLELDLTSPSLSRHLCR